MNADELIKAGASFVDQVVEQIDKPESEKIEKLQSEVEKLKEELHQVRSNLLSEYSECSRHKKMAHDLAVTIRTLQNLKHIEKELSC